MINTSRGEVINNDDLLDALKNKSIAGAAIDVWENEPGINLELMDAVDIATPHIAGYSVDGKSKGTSMSVQAASKFFGLGIDDWYPENLPDSRMDRNCDFVSLPELTSYTYNIFEDDTALRNAPETFEDLRGNYPVRREFCHFVVNGLPDDLTVLEFKKA